MGNRVWGKTNPNRRSFILAVCWAGFMAGVVFGNTSLVHGYVLQGAHVLELVVRTLSKAKTVQVEQEVTILDPGLAEEPVALTEILTYAFPDRFRSDARFAETHRIQVSARGEHLVVVDGKWKTGAPNRFDRYKDLLLLHSRSLLQKALWDYGVDVGITSLGRFEGRIVYVIGAQYPDESVSQVWVDKELFLPIRWLNVDSLDPTLRMEFIYRQWRKTQEMWYPSQIDTHDQLRLIRTIRVGRIQVDGELSADLWDPGHLKSIFAPEAAVGDEELSGGDVDEVQQAIEAFQKKFEP